MMVGVAMSRRLKALETAMAPRPPITVERTFWRPSPEGARMTGLIQVADGLTGWRSEFYPELVDALEMLLTGRGGLTVVIEKPEGSENAEG
jgi:hypothetical protein